MSARTWVNGGPPALSAANLNALEADVVAAASAAAAAQAAIPTGLARNIAVDGATTGSANNATIIQAAIDAVATAGGGDVIIPKGTWLTGPLRMKTRVRLVGEGDMGGTTLKLINGANASMITLDTIQVEAATLHNLRLDGNGANQTAGHVIFFDNTGYDNGVALPSLGDPNHHLQNLMVLNGKQHGVYIVGPFSQSHMDRVYSYLCDGNGFRFESPDNHVYNCIAAKSGLDGFYFASNSNRVVNCKAWLAGRLDASQGTGFIVSGVSRIDMIGCESQDNRQHGYSLITSTQANVSGCRADRNGLGATSAGGVGDGIFASNLTKSRIDLVAGDRNDTGLKQRWAYNLGSGNDGNIVFLAVGVTSSGVVGNGSWGPNSIVLGTYNGAALPQPVVPRPINAQTASYTTVAADAGSVIEVTSASATTVTIPADATLAYPIGTEIEVVQLGAGQVTLAAASGATLVSRASAFKLAGQYSTAALRKRAANTWIVVGDVTP